MTFSAVDSARTVSVSSTSELRGADGALAVVIDVIRSTTTAVTAVATGRRCFVAASVQEAEHIARSVPGALLAGEISGIQPDGFHLNNSPAAIATRADVDRPIVLLSSSGTRVLCEYGRVRPVLVACLRNATAIASHLATVDSAVQLIGAESRGEFRDEDQLCAARIAQRLLDEGFRGTDATLELVQRWRSVRVETIVSGTSATYLRESGQSEDLAFIIEHVDDVPHVVVSDGREVVMATAGSPAGAVDHG
jgi:2-phosphosulfolactate phosphatase